MNTGGRVDQEHNVYDQEDRGKQLDDCTTVSSAKGWDPMC